MIIDVAIFFLFCIIYKACRNLHEWLSLARNEKHKQITSSSSKLNINYLYVHNLLARHLWSSIFVFNPLKTVLLWSILVNFKVGNTFIFDNKTSLFSELFSDVTQPFENSLVYISCIECRFNKSKLEIVVLIMRQYFSAVSVLEKQPIVCQFVYFTFVFI
jgi:hypothetical protein